MDIRKVNPQPPLVAAFCFCTLFVFIHMMASPAGSRPLSSSTVVAAKKQVSKPPSSFLAVANGVTVKAADKEAVKDEQHLLKDEEYYEDKEKNHMKDEEKQIKEERKLLEKAKSAFSRGDTAAVDKLEKKLDKAEEAAKRDVSIFDKVIAAEHEKENELRSMFDNWATSQKHPSAKWLGKHDKDVRRMDKDLEREKDLEVRYMAASQAQTALDEERKDFEMMRARGRTPGL